MSYEYHWVVVYDEDWGAFMVDAETTDLNLKDHPGVVYNKTIGRWEDLEDDLGLEAEYLRLEELLAYQLTRLDLSKKVQQDTLIKTLPKEIVATRTFMYDVAGIVEDMMIMDMNLQEENITLEVIVDHIQDWLVEDFGTLNDFNIHLSDEDGKEL